MPSTNENAPVLGGSSAGASSNYVYIKSVTNGTWPTAVVANTTARDYVVIEADICASNAFSISPQYSVQLSNPLIWWTANACESSWVPCIPYSFYTYNNWVSTLIIVMQSCIAGPCVDMIYLER